MSEKAAAKVNLGLRIGARRTDGLHELCFLLCPLDFADEVEIEVQSSQGALSDFHEIEFIAQLSEKLETHLNFDHPGAAQELLRELNSPNNLAWRAVAGLAPRIFDSPRRIRVLLNKHIPVQAGLGGGSSDAAAVIRRLLAWGEKQLSQKEISEFARSLGSDVPALLQQTSCVVKGTGEELVSLDLLARARITQIFGDYRLLLCKPPFGASTGEMYQGVAQLRLERGKNPETAHGDTSLWQAWGISQARDGNYLTFEDSPLTLSDRAGNGVGLSSQSLADTSRNLMFEGPLLNDFEDVYFSKFPAMRSVRQSLKDFGADFVFLAGSGSTLVALFPRQKAQGEKFTDLERKGFFLEWTELRP